MCNPYIRHTNRDAYGNIHFVVTVDDGDRCIDFEIDAIDEDEGYEVALEMATVDYGFPADACISLEVIEPDWFNEL